MRLIKLFKNHVLAIVAVVALLVVQANADLALPNYMSEIVDVGIQQGGISSPVPDTIRESSLSDLELFMSDGDIAGPRAPTGSAPTSSPSPSATRAAPSPRP